MEPYREVTYGWIILVFMIPGQVLMTYLFITGAGDKPLSLTPFLIISFLFITVTLLFYQLKVAVFADTILITFGIGLIWKAIDIGKVENVTTVKSPFFYGWGIRTIPKGTMYNISGTKAIELSFRESNRVVRIGTPNPQKLKEEIDARIRILRPRG